VHRYSSASVLQCSPSQITKCLPNMSCFDFLNKGCVTLGKDAGCLLSRTCFNFLNNGCVTLGRDAGAGGLGHMTSFQNCVLAEYIWLDADQVPRSKTKVLTARPCKISDLPVWNYDGSSTGQAEGQNSEIKIVPRAWFNDPFRGYPHVMVLTDAWSAWDDEPAIGNTRAACAEVHEQYKKHDAWYGIEQAYMLMKAIDVGQKLNVLYGFNTDGSEPALQMPCHPGAGTGIAIDRSVADEHLARCMQAGVKIAGINSTVMPGQWGFQIGPCQGVEIGDHVTVARYIMLRVTEHHSCQVSFDPKPADGHWNGAPCQTSFSVKSMREAGGLPVTKKVCEAFGKHAVEHIEEYGHWHNEKRRARRNETRSINDFKFAVSEHGVSVHTARTTEKTGMGYIEDRRPAGNCDPYRVAARMVRTSGECLGGA